MSLSPRRLSRSLIAVTAAAAPVAVLAPAAQAAPPSPQLPRQPLQPATPTVPGSPVVTQPRILPMPSPTETVTMWVDVSAGVNVRTGPSTSYSVVGGYRQGAKLTGTLTSNNWLKLSNNRFVAAWNLTTDNPSGGSSASGTSGSGSAGSGSASSSQAVTQYLTATVGNVRSGPGLNHSVVTTMTRGTAVSGTWTSNGWLSIGGGRYISGTILSASDPTGGSSSGSGGGTSAAAPAQTVTRWVSVPVANVRSGPSTSYSVAGTKTQGTRVSGTLQSNGWLKISGSQYMAGSVLTDAEPGGGVGVAPTPAPSGIRQALVNTAAKYVGYPYVLYGTPPQAFDCSAYTWYIYQQNGITIPRTVAAQRAFVIPVSDPQPGDLVFYKNWYHVGLYAGPGMSYEAQNPQTDVVYGPIWDDEVWYGRVPGL